MLRFLRCKAVAYEEFVNLVLRIVAAECMKEGLEAGRLQVQSSLSPVVNTAGAAGKMSNSFGSRRYRC